MGAPSERAGQHGDIHNKSFVLSCLRNQAHQAATLLDVHLEVIMAPVKFKSVQKRTFKMDRLLRSETPNTLASLAEAMGVTQRTVCRDLAYMKEELGLPIEHAYGRGYYYALPVPPLEDVEQIDPRSTPPPPALRKSARATAETLEKIHSALYGQRKISVSVSRQGEDNGTWVLHPHFLSRIASRLILFAYRPERRELVNIHVEQLKGVTVLPDKFLDPPLSDVKVKEGEGWIRSGSLYKVSLRFASSLAWARDLQLADGQVLEVSGPHTTIRFRTDDLEAVRRLVFFLGDSVMVEEPAILRSLLRFHLLRMLRAYNVAQPGSDRA